MNQKTIENNFTYHPPKGNQQERYEDIRKTARKLAQTFSVLCPPDTRETALAMTNLEQAVMWANASIARNE